MSDFHSECEFANLSPQAKREALASLLDPNIPLGAEAKAFVDKSFQRVAEALKNTGVNEALLGRG